jgi:hypothetical protein
MAGVAILALTTVAHAGKAPVKREKPIGEILWVNGHDGGEWRPWKDIADDVIYLAQRHRGSQPIHSCYADEGRCSDGIMIGLNNDGQWKRFSIWTSRNPRGEVIGNRVCWFTENLDVRQCLEYGQNGDGAIEMKNFETKEWVEVEAATNEAKSKKNVDNSF